MFLDSHGILCFFALFYNVLPNVFAQIKKCMSNMRPSISRFSSLPTRDQPYSLVSIQSNFYITFVPYESA
jgi:hypothetical protein